MKRWNKLTPEEQFNESLFAVTQAVLAAAKEVQLKITIEEAGRAARAAMIQLTDNGWELTQTGMTKAERDARK